MGQLESNDELVVERPELRELLKVLGGRSYGAVQVIGGPGVGKTVLLHMAGTALARNDRSAFFVSCRDVRTADDLGAAIVAEVHAAGFELNSVPGSTVRSSAGGPNLREAIWMLNEAQTRLRRPVLLVDGLDEAAYPTRLASGIEQLVLELDGWMVVVSTRPEAARLAIRNMTRLVLGSLSPDESAALVRLHAPGLSAVVVDRIVDSADGNPLLLRLLAREVGADPTSVGLDDETVTGLFGRLLTDAIRAAPPSSGLAELVDELAIRGGRADIAELSSRLEMPDGGIHRLAATTGGTLLVVDGHSIEFAHQAFQEAVLAERIRFAPVRIADLRLGSEEAEQDDLLASTFVASNNVRTILDQRQSIVIGDRGAGKSALFRTLAEDPVIRVCPISNSGDLLHRVVAKESWTDTQALRAAWLVVIAAVVAGEIPAEAQTPLRDQAVAIRAALRLTTAQPNWLRRVGRAVIRPFRGTKLSLAVGPVTLEAELPSDGSGHRGTLAIDVESFLAEADTFLHAANRPVHVMIDRIDETYKYNRKIQEAVVQALLQAEAHIRRSRAISLIVFLRTDLFELYDIQEKNKLVSRTLTLTWTEEEWLRVLAGRLLANNQLSWLADRVPADDDLAARTALSVLLPTTIENQPIDRWLITSLSNGNGDISPRLAVLLLQLAKDLTDKSEAVATTLPIFSATTLSAAMTRLSELSFNEVTNDFKVASTFVLNCRAARRADFTPDAVAGLFDEAEGTRSEQLRLLERLGFLERVVRVTDTGVESSFRIPALYTRCWDYT